MDMIQNKLRNIYLLLFFLVAWNGGLFAKQGENSMVTARNVFMQDTVKKDSSVVIQGQVFDETNTTLPGVTIKIKGTQSGTVSDADGKFKLTLPGGKYTLIFTFIGYKSREISSSDKKLLKKVILEEDVQAIDEVVVTGYQTIDRKLFTGAATVVRADELESDGANDIARMLQGKAAGVAIQNVSGTFGGGP